MAITPKSQFKRVQNDGVDVDALINKGGAPATSERLSSPDESVAVILRVPSDMLEKIDKSVKRRPVRTPRHTWLLEALYEKLIREENGSGEEGK